MAVISNIDLIIQVILYAIIIKSIISYIKNNRSL